MKKVSIAVRKAAGASFTKDYTALKSYLLGRGYYKALSALAFAELHHVGTRKDGYTPEFHHQLTICFTIINLRGIEDIEEHCLTLALLHDVMEDYDISFEAMIEAFGKVVANDVYVLSKKHQGIVKSTAVYHRDLASNAATIIVKGADNSHNVQSMYGAFKPEKMISYLEDTKTNKLPLLKLGRKRFPQYTFAFNGLSFMLKRQVELYEAHRKMQAVETAVLAGDVANHKRFITSLQARNKDLEQLNIELSVDLDQAMKIDKLYKALSAAVSIAVTELNPENTAKFWSCLGKLASKPDAEFMLPSSLAHVNTLHANFDSSVSGAHAQPQR
jgi:hypothetical protein